MSTTEADVLAGQMPSGFRRDVDETDLTVTIPGDLRRLVADALTAPSLGERMAGRTRTARPDRLRLAADLLEPASGQTGGPA